MSEKESKHHAIIMIGAGPASLAAAVYTTREKIDTLLLEKGIIGGYAAITDKVDNYPGFPDGIAGLELSERLEKQARRFGAKIDFGEVVGLEEKDGKRVVKTQDGDYTANAVLIATGTDHKHLGIPGEEEYYGRGVHYCATCDGAFYKDKHLVVVGGGNSAAQESLFLTRFASKIDILVRDGWVASEVLVEKVKANEKISVHMGWETLKITADDHGLVNAIDARELESGKEKTFKTDGVFVFVGLKPNTAFLKDSKVKLNEFGFVETDKDLKTSMEGVYCAGDVRSGATMQIASAVGEGATAALKMREYLED